MHSIIAMKVCFFFLILASCEKKVLGERCSNALDNPVCDQCRSWCGSTGKDNSELEELIQKKIDAALLRFSPYCCRDGYNGYLGIESCDEAKIEHSVSQNETGGIFEIYQPGVGSMEVYCDTTTDQGGWTVFQRRMDGSVDFYRNWTEYVAGFGNMRGEFWLGLENIHQMTKDGHYELRIDMIRRDGRREYAKYQSFSIGPASDNYRLSVSGYSGNGSEQFLYQNDMSFTTKDADHDLSNINCAVKYIGAWWYMACHWSNLNGKYGRSGYEGVRWGDHTLTFVEMKFRKRQ